MQDQCKQEYATLVTLRDEAVQRKDWVTAAAVAARAVAWCRSNLGRSHLSVAGELIQLAQIEDRLEPSPVVEVRGEMQWSFASHLREAVRIQRSSRRRPQASTAEALQLLATMLNRRGSVAAAAQAYEEQVSVKQALLGEGHPDVAVTLTSLAAAYHAAGNLVQAATAYGRAFEIWTRHPNHIEYSDTLTGFGKLQESIGHMDSARRSFEGAIEVIQQIGLPKIPLSCAHNFLLLARLARRQKLCREALPFYRRALEIQRAWFDDSEPELSDTIFEEGLCLSACGCDDDAMASLREAMAIDQRWQARRGPDRDPELQRRALSRMTQHARSFLALAIDRCPDVGGVAGEALIAVVWRKSLELPSLIGGLIEGSDPVPSSQLRELLSLKAELSHRASEGPKDHSGDSWITHGERSRQLRERIAAIEREGHSAIIASSQERLFALRSALARSSDVPGRSPSIGAVVVEFFRLGGTEILTAQPGQACYGAIVVSVEHGSFRNASMFNLGDARSIDRAIGMYRAAIGRAPQRGAQHDLFQGPAQEREPRQVAGLRLYASLFQPLLSSIGSCRRVIVAAEGPLLYLPFEALPLGDGRYLIDEYHVSYVHSAADILVRFDDKVMEYERDLVLADPSFDLGMSRRAGELSELVFESLPGTRAEGDVVGRKLGAVVWLGDQALKGKLQTYGAPRILHLATHGFYLGEQQELDGATPRPRTDLRRRLGNRFNRLYRASWGVGFRSGLALAGANTWLTDGEPPVEAGNGLLTANDIAGLGLSGTQLVVLSACVTGVVHPDEDGFSVGLRRAFEKAGSRTVITSLWGVPDTQTFQLMETFYDYLLSGCGKSAALRLAQLKVKSEWRHPYYWAAFISHGDAGPLR